LAARRTALAGVIAGLATVATAGADPSPEAMVSLGRRIFSDASLSASGRLACAGCHDPAHAYGPPDGRAVRSGGKDLRAPGTRAVPSLRYTLNRTPVWSQQYASNPIERITAAETMPVGGFAWDGRFDHLQQQAASPFLAPSEMADAGPADVVARMMRAPYAPDFRAAFGPDVFERPDEAFGKALAAIERFELDDPSFHPYSSKFDAYLDGRAALTDAEARGLRWFRDPRKGNCDACHTSTPGADGSHPLFTDFSFAALAVPRNPEIPANADPAHFDLGLCGPLRKDLAAVARDCGMFKTPTLRNVAARRVFFHNGRFHDLREAVLFYAARDARPSRWYSRQSGEVQLYDDLPAALRGNVDRTDAPFQRGPGDPPALTEAEVDDLVAFLSTLTDADVALARR
jgi:cytochrome c peroxidase